MIKNQQTFNISLENHDTDIIVFPVPSLESIKKLNSTIHVDEKTKRQLQEDAQKESARPYVVSKVGKGVEGLKAGDLVFCNPDAMGVATVIRFNPSTFWLNPIIIPAFYAYKVVYAEEYKKEFDEIIDWYNAEQIKKEQILANS
jgi:hypothetical protein